MVTWQDPPASLRESAEYSKISEALHERPGKYARVFHGLVEGKHERSRIRTKWAQALQRRCENCRVQAVTSEDDGLYAIYAIHKEEE